MSKKVDTNGYEKNYSESGFWNKVGKFAKKAGLSVIYAGILLNIVLKKDEVSMADKAIILGALGYFITPLDLIPDITPGVGYSDDMLALIFALKKVSMHITEADRQEAKKILKKWFKNFDDSDLKVVEKIF